MSTSGGNAGTGTISSITSTGNTIAVTGGTGPTTDVEASLPVVESYISSPVTLGTSSAGSMTNITSVALGAGTWLIKAKVVVSNANAAAENADVAIGPTTGAVTSAYEVGSTSLGGTTIGAAATETITLVKKVVLASPTTVYLLGASTAAANVFADVSNLVVTGGGINLTGITATRIA